MNFLRILISAVTLLSAQSASAQALPTLQLGDTWHYQQYQVVGQREKRLADVDLRVSYRTDNGRWALARFKGPKSFAELKQQGQTPVLEHGPTISSMSCVVDLFDGFNLLTDKGCNPPPAPKENWSRAIQTEKSSITVMLEHLGMESVEVPAGQFTAYRFKLISSFTPRSSDDDAPPPTEYEEVDYWYATEVRGMVKIERHYFDSQRSPTHKAVHKLASFGNL